MVARFTSRKVEYEAVKSRGRHMIDEWQVEGIDFDNDGIIYVTLFSGGDNKQRALEYAGFKNSQETQKGVTW